MSVVEKVENLMLPICEATGVSLVNTLYEEENGMWHLRIFVDTEVGLTMEECVTVTELISESLDEADFIAQEYMMEVSSPGAERPLTTAQEMAEAVGKYINVTVKEAIDEIFEFQGDLVSFESDILIIECLFKTRKKRIKINYRDVKKARLAVRF